MRKEEGKRKERNIHPWNPFLWDLAPRFSEISFLQNQSTASRLVRAVIARAQAQPATALRSHRRPWHGERQQPMRVRAETKNLAGVVGNDSGENCNREKVHDCNVEPGFAWVCVLCTELVATRYNYRWILYSHMPISQKVINILETNVNGSYSQFFFTIDQRIQRINSGGR